MDPRVVERWTGGFSIAAGAVHGTVAPEHFAQWWGYGLFFLAAATAQIVYGLALIVGVVDPDRPLTVAERRVFYGLGVGGNVGIMALYVVTRTVGIPFLGPEAGVVEGVGALDVVSKIYEAVVVVMLLLLLARTRDPAP